MMQPGCSVARSCVPGLEHRLARLLLGQLGLRPVAGADRAQVDDLRRRVRHPEAVELLVERVEALLQVLAPRHRDLVALAAVAHVGEELDVLGLGGMPCASIHSRARDSSSSRISDASPTSDVSRISVCANSLRKPATRSPSAQSRPGRRRHDHRERAHQLRDRVGVQRPGAAEGHQRELARVVAALHGDHAQRAGHVLVDDPQDAVGGLLEAQPHRVGDLLHGRARRLDVERHLAADQVGREMAEDDVGVGHGRLGAALAVGRRAGLGARRLRADAQRARSAPARARSSRRRRRPCARRRSGP